MHAVVSDADPKQVNNNTTQNPVTCTSCHSQIGEWDPITSGIKLYKPFIDVRNSSKSMTRPTTAQWMTCYLDTLVSNLGVRKFQARFLPFSVS